MIRCLCIDDESLALEMMEDFIRKVPFLQLVAICNNPINAFTILILKCLRFLEFNLLNH